MSYNILCIDDDTVFLQTTKSMLKKSHRVLTATNTLEGRDLLKTYPVDLVILDRNLQGQDGLDILKYIRTNYPTVDVIMLTASHDLNDIVSAIKSGANDYLCKPVAEDELVAAVEKQRKNREVRDRYDALVENLNQSKNSTAFIGQSPVFLDVMEQARKLKGYEANVLLEGESGTGKELLAQFIHRQEENPRRPFIAVNCAAIPEALIESELFGYEQGAFTGAFKRKIGKFELAGGGDIFLDEINTLKPELQAKLLRILQEKKFYRLGGTQPIQVSFRVITATNVNLHHEVTRGTFRQDLLYRLRVVSLTMPPLRERVSDIPALIEHFLNKHCRSGELKQIAPEAVMRLQDYPWPGNIRELENLIQSLIIMSKGQQIGRHDLPEWIKPSEGALDNPAAPGLRYEVIQASLRDFLERVERDYVKQVIRASGGNISKAAQTLKVSRSKVYYTIKQGEFS